MGLFVMLLGVQGAGKGEQAKFIERTYGIPQLSTGDLMRAMKTRSDALAKRVQDIMAAGQLVDDATTNEIVVERLTKPDAQGGVIFDGYPRNPAQADFLEAHLASKSETLSAVMLLELDLYIAFKRAFGRVKTASGDTYNIYTMPDAVTVRHDEDPAKVYVPRIVATLNATGEELMRRPDDANPAAVIKRIDTYLAETQPLIDYYAEKGLLHTIPADQPIDAVSALIKSKLDAIAPKK